jgi:SAM-dependent methyltransferase
VKWLALAVAIAWALDAIRLRRRIRTIPRLESSTLPTSTDYRVILAEGVELPESVLRDAGAYAARAGLLVLDLVPGNWPAQQFFELSQLVDMRTYRLDRLARGQSAGHATLVHRSVLDRLPQAKAWNLTASRLRFPRYQVLRLASILKQYACTATDMVVAADLAAVPDEPGRRFAHVKEVFGNPARFVVFALPIMLALQVLLVIAEPLFGGVALAVFHAQPFIVLLGTPVDPRAALLNSLLRFPLELWRWLQMVTATWRPEEDRDPMPGLRERYSELLREGTDAFFEARTEECPLCCSGDLSPLLSSPDLVQQKPGIFVLEKCAQCGHIFQNPRLSPAGLAFYYRDFYDGLYADYMAALFGHGAPLYLDRARTLRGIATPRHWLDVGAGHGHFCCVARDVWPETVFDALDQSDAVEEGRRRGWIDHAYRGVFPDLASDLAVSYDVVSMFHYLEHTREPRDELRAAHRALVDGGYLLIEVPDPDAPIGRKLGKWWFPWFQPQHQHLINIANMDRLLRELGFQPVLRQTGNFQKTLDLFFMTYLMLNWLAPHLPAPWLPPAGRLGSVRQCAVWTLGIPVLCLAWLLDQIRSSITGTAEHSAAYRVLARKTAG